MHFITYNQCMQIVFHAVSFFFCTNRSMSVYVKLPQYKHNSAGNGELTTHSIFHPSPTMFTQIKTNINCTDI